MSDEIENPPAFPEPCINSPNLDLDCSKGMTLRDYFAAKAMNGLLGKYNLTQSADQGIITQLSYELADAMLKARNQNPLK